jgi:class 3 adenylate cyclase/ligand-binding sensor domain-containing protein
MTPFCRSIRTALARLHAAFLALLLAGAAFGQRYFFENISNQQGLPAAKVYCAAQSPDGIIWVGTEVGLASYDGMNVVSHGTADGTAPGGVFSLLVDRDGGIWAGHLDGGITWSKGRAFRSCTLGNGVSSAITAWVQEKDGSILVATMGSGLWRVTGTPAEDGTLNARRIGAEAGLQDRILSIAALPDGRVALVSDGSGMQALAGDRITELNLAGVPDVFRRTAIFVDGKGRIWVGTQGGGAYRCSLDGRCDRFDILTGLRSNTIYCFGEDGEGQVWIGTTDGGASCVTSDGVRSFGPDNGLHGRFVRCLVRDREGNLLIGTNESGLDIFKGDRFISYGESEGLSDPKVFAVMEDRNQRTWFGTNAGIVVLDATGRLVEQVTSQKGQLTSNFVRCLREDDKGYVWVGTENGGLLRFDPRSGKAQEALEVSGSLADLRVTALEVGQPGELWVGGVNGLWRYLPGGGTVPTPYRTEDGLAGNHINAIFRDRDGTIWVGSTTNGVTRIDNGKATRIDLGRSFAASCFTQDQEGRIWVGTEGQGIIVLKDGKEQQRFTAEQGLLSNAIKALATDEQGHIWIGTTKGLNKWRHKQEGFIAFTERAGFTGIEVKPNAVCALRGGGVLFGTVNGATRVGDEREAERTVAPLVTIRGWTVNLEERPLEGRSSLSHDERSIRLRYGCVALSDPGAVRYMYLLDGLEDDWQPITSSTEAAYPALPPGTYTFKVKAMDRSGLWSEPPAELSFTIHPPWYRSWWFYSALAIFIGASLFSYIKVRERQLRLRNLVLEKKVEERTAEVVAQSKEIEGQKERIEDLLLNILPKEISEELKEKGKATARRHDEVTVVFTDMKGFTRVAEKMTPEELVSELDDCFVQFDEIVGRYGIEKIKTIGDSYMCAAGVPTGDAWHAHRCVLAALEVRELMSRWQKEHRSAGKEPWALRIGVHSGPVVAGVVGKRKFAYDIWGDTVNTASRMESSGEVGEVNISGATYRLVKDHFECVHRGQVEAKNKGAIDMYFVKRIKPEFSANAEGTRPNERLLRLCCVSLAQELA